MKRDMDLVRKILLQAEESVSSDISMPISIKGYSEEQIKYHLRLLSDAKFITPEYAEFKGVHMSGGSMMAMRDNDPRRLTWEAHEFLDAIRKESVWNKTKERVSKQGGGFVLSIVKDLAVSYLRQEMGLS